MTEPDIRHIERALREAGLSRRQAKALLHRGWGGVVEAQQAEADMLRMELDALRASLAPATIAASPPAA